MLDSRRMRQIFQTVTGRLEEGKSGPPNSYSEEEKENTTLRPKKAS